MMKSLISVLEKSAFFVKIHYENEEMFEMMDTLNLMKSMIEKLEEQIKGELDNELPQ